jgi:hypothetical protein
LASSSEFISILGDIKPEARLWNVSTVWIFQIGLKGSSF